MKIELYINKRYLLIPVYKKGPTTLISVFNDDNKIYEFMIPVLQNPKIITLRFILPLPAAG